MTTVYICTIPPARCDMSDRCLNRSIKPEDHVHVVYFMPQSMVGDGCVHYLPKPVQKEGETC